MGWLAEKRAELRRDSLAWHTRPHTVWSDHGARRRQVMVVWRRDDRDMFRYDALRIIAGFAFLAALLVFSALAPCRCSMTGSPVS